MTMARIDINHILGEPSPLYLQRVRFVDGDYAPDGTYWGGGGAPLWCAFTPDLSTEVYVRARSRAEAFEAVKAECPEATLFRAP